VVPQRRLTEAEDGEPQTPVQDFSWLIAQVELEDVQRLASATHLVE